MNQSREIAYTSVLKTLQVMTEKGLVIRNEGERAHVYTPTFSVDVLLTFGVLKAYILLPPSALLGLSTDYLEALIAHELAHIRQHDTLVNFFQSGIHRPRDFMAGAGAQRAHPQRSPSRRSEAGGWAADRDNAGSYVGDSESRRRTTPGMRTA